MKKKGKLSGKKMIGSKSEPQKIKSSTFSTDRLTFDGYKLVWHGSAVSEYVGFSGQADEKSNEADKDLGPTPQGMYTIDPGNIEELDTTDPDTNRDWGAKRVRLEPWKKTRKRMLDCLKSDRKGFYIHGGTEKGTTGCIELNNKKTLNSFFSKLKKYGKKIDIEIKYSGKRKKKYEKADCPYHSFFTEPTDLSFLNSDDIELVNDRIIAECAVKFSRNSEDCNKFLKAVAAAFFEPDLFSGPGMNADAIIEEIRDSDEWKQLGKSHEDAIRDAKRGKFVIAGMTSTELTSNHGHLAVVISDDGKLSGTVLVPICFAGSLNSAARVQRKRVSETFGKTVARSSKISYFSRDPEVIPAQDAVSKLVDYLKGLRSETDSVVWEK